MNDVIELEGKKYELIEGTQGDGRCFSASIYYDLNNKIPTDDELNEWIQNFIINPINNADCSQFLIWAYKWVGLHNSSNHWSAIKDKIQIPDSLNKISIILDRLNTFIETLQSLNNNNDDNENVKNVYNTLLDNVNSLNESLNDSELIDDELTGEFERLNTIMLESIEQLNSIKSIDIIQLNNGNIYYISELSNKLCNNYKTNFSSDYELLATPYLKYIQLLNTPQKNSVGDIYYEWTEPNAGPIEILLTNEIINSINIYSEISKQFTYYMSPILKINKQNLYLHYSGSHYKPLIPINNPIDRKMKPKDIPTSIDRKMKPKDIPTSIDRKMKPKDIPTTNNTTPSIDGKDAIKDIKTDVVSKSKEENKESESKIPNSLIIYIKTRIPNFYKVNYEPFMSVPKSKSHTVYFDPLVKYYEGPIKNLPTGAPKDAVISQFVEATEFDYMINRILSDFRYMQKKRTFKEAYESNIIENNLEITLKNLFKNDNLFYINKKPYTIVGVKSNPSDWQIDKKPLEKLLNQFSHLSIKQLEQEATKEEDNIPEIMRQGNMASSTLTESQTMDTLTNGLKQASDVLDNKAIEKDIFDNDTFIKASELPGVSEDIVKLLSKYLRKNIPINYSNNVDLARDPLTLSLLVDKKSLLSYINANKKTTLIELYSTFNKSKESLNIADNVYMDYFVELGKYKKQFEYEIKNIRTAMRDKTGTEMRGFIEQIVQLKVGYLQIIFKIADAINQIYTEQRVYFVSTKTLLEALYTDYGSIIQYYEKPELASKCIQYDIACINSLIDEDVSNPSSVSYFTNYKRFKQFYDNQLYKHKQELLEPQINLSEEAEIYTTNNQILLIEKEQYELYNFKMFLEYSYNQLDIWVNLFKSLELFIRDIRNFTSNIIILCDEHTQQFNNEFPLEQQNKLLLQIEAEGIMAILDRKTKQFTWKLVKNNGANAINTKSTTEKKFEQMYINYIKTSVKAYDAIILYIYLLEVLYLRQLRVYVAEENVNQLNLEFSLTLDMYYKFIEKHISQQPKPIVSIPTSILWDTRDFNDIEKINIKQKQTDNQYIIYKARIKSIAQSRDQLVLSCEEISKLITPNIGKAGFINKCNDILTSQFSSTYKFRSSWWLTTTIENYDIQSTNDFIYNMNKVVKDAWYDNIIEDISVNSYLDWIVFNNDNYEIDSLYASIAYGLNGHLILTNNETTNPYTTIVNAKKVFTTNTIKKLVTDYNNENINLDNFGSLNGIIKILETTLKIKFIIFTMYENNIPTSIGDIVLYRKHQYRIISKTEKDGNIFYNLYNGYTTIHDIPSKKIKINPNNFLKYFRLYCDYSPITEDIEINDYMYIVLTKYKNDDNVLKNKFKLVRDTNMSYIFNVNEIPNYIKYFIFNSCPSLSREIIIQMGFNEKSFIKDILNFEIQRKKRIENENIKDDIAKIESKIKRYTTIYKSLKAIPDIDKPLEQQAEQLLYKEEIKELKQKKDLLYKIIGDNKTTYGGATTLSPSQQYSYMPQNYPYIPQYNPLGYPLNPGYQLNGNIPGNIIYMPRQGYPYQNSYYNNSNLDYNISQNKAKDQKSKLSFYITIELELFPGTSANILEKSIVKCKSTFERIREAWADIFGFEYRPSPMSEAYQYNLKKDDDTQQKNEQQDYKNNKTEKLHEKTVGGNNKTRKRRYK
jgi:hypothetical protein